MKKMIGSILLSTAVLFSGSGQLTKAEDLFAKYPAAMDYLYQNYWSSNRFTETEWNDTIADAMPVKSSSYIDGILDLRDIDENGIDHDFYTFNLENESLFISRYYFYSGMPSSLANTVLYNSNHQKINELQVTKNRYGTTQGVQATILKPGQYTLELNAKELNAEGYALYTGSPVTRLAGKTRIETAVSISKYGWEETNTVILASGANFPDALSATPLAGKYDAPLLLSAANSLPAAVEQELKRLKVKKVIIIGGPSVVSDSVKGQIEAITNDGQRIQTSRVYGTDRYETSLKIAESMLTDNYSGNIFFVTGKNFADALSIAPFTKASNDPIILIDNNKPVPAGVKALINKFPGRTRTIIGGPALISDKHAYELQTLSIIYGQDRYETNKLIFDEYRRYIGRNSLILATGENFPDSLAGSALAAHKGEAVLLTKPTSKESTKEVFNEHFVGEAESLLLGGEAVLPYYTFFNLYQ